MPSIQIARLTESAGVPVPFRGTLPAAANQLYVKGCMVQVNSAGRAINPSTNDLSGLKCVGVCQATLDNRTNSETGGLDDSQEVELEYGVFGFNISGATPKPGDLVYVFDNQTVTLAIGATRGVAGRVCEVRLPSVGTALQAYVMIGPVF